MLLPAFGQHNAAKNESITDNYRSFSSFNSKQVRRPRYRSILASIQMLPAPRHYLPTPLQHVSDAFLPLPFSRSAAQTTKASDGAERSKWLVVWRDDADPAHTQEFCRMAANVTSANTSYGSNAGNATDCDGVEFRNIIAATPGALLHSGHACAMPFHRPSVHTPIIAASLPQTAKKNF